MTGLEGSARRHPSPPDLTRFRRLPRVRRTRVNAFAEDCERTAAPRGFRNAADLRMADCSLDLAKGEQSTSLSAARNSRKRAPRDFAQANRAQRPVSARSSLPERVHPAGQAHRPHGPRRTGRHTIPIGPEQSRQRTECAGTRCPSRQPSRHGGRKPPMAQSRQHVSGEGGRFLSDSKPQAKRQHHRPRRPAVATDQTETTEDGRTPAALVCLCPSPSM